MEMNRMTWRVAVLMAAAVMCCANFVSMARGLALKDLNRTLEVKFSLADSNASSSDFTVRTGIDDLSVTWALNSSAEAAEAKYKSVKVQLCFTSESQKDRPWRKKNEGDLSKDKTCSFTLGSTQPYKSMAVQAVLSKSVPAAKYFVRAYVLNEDGSKVAYGQSNSTFTVEPISGRHASIDVAAAVFSAFAIVSLFGFYIVERKLFVKKV